MAQFTIRNRVPERTLFKVINSGGIDNIYCILKNGDKYVLSKDGEILNYAWYAVPTFEELHRVINFDKLYLLDPSNLIPIEVYKREDPNIQLTLGMVLVNLHNAVKYVVASGCAAGTLDLIPIHVVVPAIRNVITVSKQDFSVSL